MPARRCLLRLPLKSSALATRRTVAPRTRCTRSLPSCPRIAERPLCAPRGRRQTASRRCEHDGGDAGRGGGRREAASRSWGVPDPTGPVPTGPVPNDRARVSSHACGGRATPGEATWQMESWLADGALSGGARAGEVGRGGSGVLGGMPSRRAGVWAHLQPAAAARRRSSAPTRRRGP